MTLQQGLCVSLLTNLPSLPLFRVVGRRFQSTDKISTTFLTANGGNFKKNWLQDPSTYPMIVVLGAAGLLVGGVGISCLSFSPDVQIDPKKRGAVVRTWVSTVTLQY